MHVCKPMTTTQRRSLASGIRFLAPVPAKIITSSSRLRKTTWGHSVQGHCLSHTVPRVPPVVRSRNADRRGRCLAGRPWNLTASRSNFEARIPGAKMGLKMSPETGSQVPDLRCPTGASKMGVMDVISGQFPSPGGWMLTSNGNFNNLHGA